MGLTASNDDDDSEQESTEKAVKAVVIELRASRTATSSSQLLDLSARELLDNFGAGRHKPGSGSAAALAGVISCKLLHTVISLCRDRAAKVERIKIVLPQLNKVDALIVSKIEPYLLSAVQTDADQFHRVITARKKRDNESDELKKAVYAEEALSELVAATEIPLEIAGHCLELAERGLEVFDRGFDSARGDTGVATSTALATALGALSVVFLNLKSFRHIESDAIIKSMRETADTYFEKARIIQNAIFGRVQRLQKESAIDSTQLPLL